LATYIIRRVLYSIPVLFATSFLIFTFVILAGKPTDELRLNPRTPLSVIHNLEEKHHLNDSIPVQYGYWIRDFVLNDGGSTLLGDRKVMPDIRRVLPHTIQLYLSAEIIALIFALGIGIYSSVRQYSIFDYTATTFSFIGFAMPVFWLALILQILFTNIYLKYDIRIFYTGSLNSANPGHGLHFVLDRFQHLGIPIVTLAVLNIAQYSRFLRASMLEVISSDYVRTARAKGLTERRVVLRHAFRNALIPLSTVVALNFGAVFGGAVVTESIFALDGMGTYFIHALGLGDPYPIMAWLLVTAIMVLVFNLVADILLGYLDPRIRLD
jgi:peptide/nickel transport system permease protein